MTYLTKFWIGLHEKGRLHGEYAWKDGTALDYVYWKPGFKQNTLV